MNELERAVAAVRTALDAGSRPFWQLCAPVRKAAGKDFSYRLIDQAISAIGAQRSFVGGTEMIALPRTATPAALTPIAAASGGHSPPNPAPAPPNYSPKELFDRRFGIVMSCDAALGQESFGEYLACGTRLSVAEARAALAASAQDRIEKRIDGAAIYGRRTSREGIA